MMGEIYRRTSLQHFTDLGFMAECPNYSSLSSVKMHKNPLGICNKKAPNETLFSGLMYLSSKHNV